MKRSLLQIGIGLLPILLGFGSTLLFILPVPLFLTNLLFFALWVWLCFRFCDPFHPILPQLLRVCVPGALILTSVLLWELRIGNDLPEILIHASQFYFLSGIQLAGRILTPFLKTITDWPYCIVDYVFMTSLCFLSMGLKKKVT